MNTPVNLAIFASRESLAELAATFEHAQLEVTPGSFIDVLINGNESLASQFLTWNSQREARRDITLRIWHLAAPDKANAWNQHIHEISIPGLDAIYIDGYVKISANAVSELDQTLNSNHEILGSSGVPTVGRSAKTIAKTMQLEGGFHGNLCAIRSTAMAEMRKRNIRIQSACIE